MGKNIHELSIMNSIESIDKLRRKYENERTCYNINSDIVLNYDKRKKWIIVYKGHEFASCNVSLISGAFAGMKVGATLGIANYLNMKTKDITVVNNTTFKTISKALKESIPRIKKEIQEDSAQKWK